MLDRLAVRDLPVTELAESFRMSLPAVSQHLKVLREAGLVKDRRVGLGRRLRAFLEDEVH